MRQWARFVIVAIVLASAGAVPAPQVRDATRPATGTGQITGTVVSDDATPAPIRRVTMTLTGEFTGVRAVAVTDDEGRFGFTSLPADRYTLSAAKAAYLPWNYGSRRASGSGTPIVVADGRQVGVSMTLYRGSVLSGAIRDEQGAPLPGVVVTALRFAVSTMTGERQLQAARIGSAQTMVQNYAADAFPGTAATDDRGAYRIFGLAPGEYVLAAAVRPPRGSPMVATDIRQVSRADVQRAEQLLRATGSAMPVGPVPAESGGAPVRVDYAPVYYPASFSAADATTVTLGRAEERVGLDIIVRLVPTAVVSGAVSLPDGTPYWGAQVSLLEPGGSPNAGQVARLTRSNEDGHFAIPGIGPGRYVLRAHASNDGFAGSTDLFVSGSEVSASIVMVPGVTVSGRIVFDGTPPPVGERPVWMILSPSPLGVGLNFDYRPDGSFTIARVPAGQYRLVVNGRPPAGWTLRAAMLDSRDVSDVTFDVRPGEPVDSVVVTFTDRGGEISGRFLDEAGRPAPEYELIVFSADPAYQVSRTRRTQHVRPDINGMFVARDLPAGDYFISAVPKKTQDTNR
jgi:protocatechuate 3,4-dioxygenase beta subunit